MGPPLLRRTFFPPWGGCPQDQPHFFFPPSCRVHAETPLKEAGASGFFFFFPLALLLGPLLAQLQSVVCCLSSPPISLGCLEVADLRSRQQRTRRSSWLLLMAVYLI